MKATEQYFHVVLFTMLYKMVLTLKSVDKTLVFDHSVESNLSLHSGGKVLLYLLIRPYRYLNIQA